MKKIALVTDSKSLPLDYDMPLLVEACKQLNIQADIVNWTDQEINWAAYSLVIPRSTWSYVDNCQAFLDWCERVKSVTTLCNPAEVIRWGVDKFYLQDLENHQVAIVPSVFSRPYEDADSLLERFTVLHQTKEFIVKPTVGAYSRNVRRYAWAQREQAIIHIDHLVADNLSVIIQPYLKAIDQVGETNLVYFNGEYSHSIKKESLLQTDGSVRPPLQELRHAGSASSQEQEVAQFALKAIKKIFKLDSPLLYARIDLIQDDNQQPCVLELGLINPSLNLPFTDTGANAFAAAISRKL